MPEPKSTGGVVLPSDITWDSGVHLLEYQRAVRETDRLPQDDLRTPVLGLFGEVGSLLSVVKKRKRDAVAYVGYDAAIIEELGDALWYFTCIANRVALDLSVLAQWVFCDASDRDECQADEFGTWGDVQSARPPANDEDLFASMSLLAGLTGKLVGGLRGGLVEGSRERLSGDMSAVLRSLIGFAAAADLDLDVAARQNLEKIFSRYPRELKYPPLPDDDVASHERLPRRFDLFVGEHDVNGKTYVMVTCNGVIIGDRVTDNKAEEDDYRFHDVFHIAYAVHLSWSPILRGLFRVKRKSMPGVDENEDGARAGLIEEGVATFIFGRALEQNLFEDLEHLDFDLLKLVRGFVRGFEVERCALWQWERAILDGFKVYREFKKNRCGYVVADLVAHTIEFRAAGRDEDGLNSVAIVGRRE